MDLCEVKDNFKRHPWELARVKALAKILTLKINNENVLRVLDIGCGDAFTVRNVLKGFNVESIDGVDINLSDSEIEKLSILYNNITFHNKLERLKADKYNLILLSDVLEHIKDDGIFLNEIINNYLDSGEYLLITVPAYNFLYSSHDRFLRHYRRYNLRELIHLINGTFLEPLSYGYLFLPLIPIRLISLYHERLAKVESMANKGVGVWEYNMVITNTIALILTMGNIVSITLARFGIKLPGLTVWALCKKQRL